MNKTKDELINMLLKFMNDDIELNGHTTRTCEFNFNPDGEDYLSFKKGNDLADSEIVAAINLCRSREYVEHTCMGDGNLLRITTDGQGRAISNEKAKKYKPEPTQQNFNIGNIHGPTQIGNHNTQNVEGAIKYIIDEINKSDATDDQKAEAKGLLQKAIEHPVISSTIGSSAGALLTMLGG